MKPYIIWKGSPQEGLPYKKNTIQYEICSNGPDSYGKQYPSADKVFMTVTKTANANWEMTIEVLDQVLLPEIDAGPGAILCDGFKGHSTKEVKEKV